MQSKLRMENPSKVDSKFMRISVKRERKSECVLE